MKLGPNNQKVRNRLKFLINKHGFTGLNSTSQTLRLLKAVNKNNSTSIGLIFYNNKGSNKGVAFIPGPIVYSMRATQYNTDPNKARLLQLISPNNKNILNRAYRVNKINYPTRQV